MWKMAMIDDDPNVLRVMKKIMPWEACDLEWVGEGRNGQQGLELIRAAQPDIVITDLYMPVLHGLDMIEQLRSEGYGGKFVILSGYSDFEYARKSVRFGVDDYLLKPVTADMLLQVISNVVKKLGEERLERERQNDASRKLRTYEPFVLKEWLASVVNGTYQENIYHERIVRTQSDVWLTGNYAVLAIDAESKQPQEEIAISDWKQLRFAIGNIVDDVLLQQSLETTFVPLQSCMGAVVMRFAKESDEGEVFQQIQQVTDTIADCVKRYLKTDVVIGIGQLKDDWKRVNESAREAVAALRVQAKAYQTELSERHLKFYRDLNQAISQSQSENVKALILDFTAYLHSVRYVTPAFLQQTAMEIWTLLEYGLYCAGIVVEETSFKLKPEHSHDRFMTVQQFEDWLGRIVEQLTASSQMNENLKHRVVVDQVIHYIHEHYAEEITLEELADVAAISRNYLCLIFKSVTGETYNQFLTRVRIEKAKAMILEGRWLVYEISEKVGYKNFPYFSTLFKKMTGCTPSEFAKVKKIVRH